MMSKKRKFDGKHEAAKKNLCNEIVLNMTIRNPNDENLLDFSKDRDMFEYEEHKRKETEKKAEHSNDEQLNNDSMFLETQCLKELDVVVANAQNKQVNVEIVDRNNISNSMPRSSQLKDMFDTEFILDDFQSSQKFFHDIRNTQTRVKSQTVANAIKEAEKNVTVVHTRSGSDYIQRQRDMYEMNLENLDDDFLEDFTSQEFQVSQYRREVEAEFNVCERTICGEHFNEPIEHEEQNNLDAAISAIDDINWDSPIQTRDPKTPHNTSVVGSASMIVRQKLQNLKPRRLDVTGTASSSTSKLLRPVSTSNFCDRGPFFGLPTVVQSLIKEFKGIDNLYDWQKECLQLPSITKRTNLIYALPTSGGKTLVSEILILREILCRQKNVIFILPFVSIVKEKVWALSPFAVGLNFLVEEYAAGKGKCPPTKRRHKNSVFVCTIEKSLSLIDSLSEEGRISEVGLIIVDELHLLGEQGRGAILESTLTKVIYLQAGIQVVGMSATIGNLHEIAKYLKADVYSRDFRPVELLEYIKIGNDILKINPAGQTAEETFLFQRTVTFGYTKETTERDRDHIAGLVMEVIPENSVLIFCSSKKSCENVSVLLCTIFGKRYLKYRAAEKSELMKAIRRDTSSPLCEVLRQTIPHGVAYHHSGLTTDERKHLEDAFRLGILSVICCTSTLAAGVNLPARRVIIRSPYVGNQFITLSKYKQMVGRAGRAGLGQSGESFLICQPKDNQRVAEFLCAPMDTAKSSMLDNGQRGVHSLVLSSIGLGLANKRPDIKKLLSCTLLAVQSEQMGVNLNSVVDDTIKYLFKKKALQKRNHCTVNDSDTSMDVHIMNSQETDQNISQMLSTVGKRSTIEIFITNSMTFEISKLGKAAVRACLDLERANILHKDLVAAQKNFVLSDYLHLLYLVVPQDKIEEIRPDLTIYYTLYSKLSPKQLLTARVLGITELCAIKMATNKPFQPEMMMILKRFYVALMLQDLWNSKGVYEVSQKFSIDRGIIQQIMSLVATNTGSIIRFCEELEEFWAIKALLSCLSARLSHFCRMELLPLMELPAVKIGRARQLYMAGYTNLQTIARADSKDLVTKIEHMNYRVAKQLIAAARLLLLERVETLREEVQDVLDVMK